MASTKNPESKSINQKRGPTTGNQNPGSKRGDFIKEKTSGFRTELSDFVMNALGRRGDGMKPATKPYAEPLDADRGPKANPTAGGTRYNVKSRAPGKVTR